MAIGTPQAGEGVRIPAPSADGDRPRASGVDNPLGDAVLPHAQPARRRAGRQASRAIAPRSSRPRPVRARCSGLYGRTSSCGELYYGPHAAALGLPLASGGPTGCRSWTLITVAGVRRRPALYGGSGSTDPVFGRSLVSSLFLVALITLALRGSETGAPLRHVRADADRDRLFCAPRDRRRCAARATTRSRRTCWRALGRPPARALLAGSGESLERLRHAARC